MTLEFVNEYIEDKFRNSEDIVIYYFFELRIKCNLTEEDTNKFLELAKNKFENMHYQVYFTGAKYTYKGLTTTVPDNELMVAVKEEMAD